MWVVVELRFGAVSDFEVSYHNVSYTLEHSHSMRMDVQISDNWPDVFEVQKVYSCEASLTGQNECLNLHPLDERYSGGQLRIFVTHLSFGNSNCVQQAQQCSKPMTFNDCFKHRLELTTKETCFMQHLPSDMASTT